MTHPAPPATSAVAPRSFAIVPIALLALCVGVQALAWSGVWPALPGKTGRLAFGITEMLLMAALLVNGVRIRQWLGAQAALSDRSRLSATWVPIALAICVLGDAVNRNFSGRFFSYDSIIEHSYLADSVWFFFPGYGLFIAVVWWTTRGRVSTAWRWLPLLITSAAGIATFVRLLPEGVSPYIQLMTGSYTVLISTMMAAAIWMLKAEGGALRWVALGAVLATVADALIGEFWLFRPGHYPGIAHLNFVVYFASQALIQAYPLRLFERDRTGQP